MFLNGNFVALAAFKKAYGVMDADGQYSIQAKWQSALFQAGQCGAFVGVFLSGPVTTRLGYRWTTILALIAMNGTIFISFFVSSSRCHLGRLLGKSRADNILSVIQANSLSVLTLGQFFEGIPWGFFIANSPAFASEVVPLALRGATTATIQMSWSIGSIIVAAVTYCYNDLPNSWAWRAPLAYQWMFPVRISSTLENDVCVA